MEPKSSVILIHPEKKAVSQKQKYRFLIGFSIVLILIGLFSSPINETVAGMIRILTSPSNLFTDYIALGNFGSAFLNSGVLLLFSVLLTRMHNMQISGPMMAALFAVAGFSFFGKNLYNTLPIIIGVYLYAYIVKKPYSQYVMISLFGSSVSPVISYITFGMDLPLWLGIFWGYIVGIAIGLFLPPLSAHFLTFHQGFSLYNIGFTSGIIAMVITGFLRMFDNNVEMNTIIATDVHQQLLWILLGLFSLFFLYGFWLNHFSFSGLKAIYRTSGKLITDFIVIAEMGPTLINMAIMGFTLTMYVVVTNGQLNGAVLGSILSAVGFTAFGAHLRNSLPVIIGAFLALQFTPLLDVTETGTIVAVVFSIGLAPISGYYGNIYGLIAGFIQLALVSNVSYLHGGLNLYNTGFSSGFVAAFIVPLLDNFTLLRKDKRNARKRTLEKNHR